MYDVGGFENLKQVFGNNKLIWFLPIYPKSTQVCDGVSWP